MTIRAHLDDHFARQFGGLPQIDPPVPLAPELSVMPMRSISVAEFEAMFNDESTAQHEAENGLFAEGDECAS